MKQIRINSSHAVSIKETPIHPLSMGLITKKKHTKTIEPFKTISTPKDANQDSPGRKAWQPRQRSLPIDVDEVIL